MKTYVWQMSEKYGFEIEASLKKAGFISLYVPSEQKLKVKTSIDSEKIDKKIKRMMFAYQRV